MRHNQLSIHKINHRWRLSTGRSPTEGASPEPGEAEVNPISPTEVTGEATEEVTEVAGEATKPQPPEDPDTHPIHPKPAVNATIDMVRNRGTVCLASPARG